MRWGLGSRVVGLALTIVAVTAIWAITARAQSEDSIALVKRTFELYQAGKYSEAVPVAQRYADMVKRQYGIDAPEYAIALNNLAELYRVQGRHRETEPLIKLALAIAEKAHGSDHPNVGAYVNTLSMVYFDQGRYGEAEPLIKRALAIAEKALGPNHLHFVTRLNNLAELYRVQGRYGEAEPLIKRALAIIEKTRGPDDPEVSIRLSSLAVLYQDQGRYGEAEPLKKRAIAIADKALGPDHPDVAGHLNNLAELYRVQGRYGEAEPLLKRAVVIAEKAFGSENPRVGVPLNNLVELYRAQGRYGEAEPLMKRALAIGEKAFGPENPRVGEYLNTLAVLYWSQRRYDEAEPLMKRALAISEKAFGLDHPEVGGRLNNLAYLYDTKGRYGEAEPLFKRALAIGEKTLGPDHPDISGPLSNLAGLYSVQRDWARAADFWRRSTDMVIRRAQRGALDMGQPLTGKGKSEAEQLNERFLALVKVVYRLALEQRNADTALQREMFQTAQWTQSSEAAVSLAQMAARAATGNSKLATLVRERQDLVFEWQKLDVNRGAAVARAPNTRDAKAEGENMARSAVIDTRIAVIDKQLAADFPDYAVLASPAPLSVNEVQAQLGEDEAVVLFLDSPKQKTMAEETFIWVVTKTDSRWVRTGRGTAALTSETVALRCGLDRSNWTDADKWPEDGAAAKQRKIEQQVRRGRCKELLGRAVSDSDLPPFDLARAHELYKALFDQIEDVVKDKQLLIVPSGPLTQLPFQVLVTEPPKAALPDSVGDYRDVAWLARKQTITVLPAVSSLKALREYAKESHASEFFIGFGNPLLEGEPAKYEGDAAAAKLAREKRCTAAPSSQIASLSDQRGGVRAMAILEGRLANIADVRRQAPLPETADELCDVAQNLGVDPATHLYLGATATETKIKQLSDNGTLASYRIVHFATHGALAGQISRVSEPGLVLTPPPKASEADDGYLTASEVAALKLDADWVILSACNTAAGGAEGAEALSGLARAFFFAGARSLLVSHWAVNSGATVKLVTKAMAELKAEPKIGRAEALRRSMLKLIGDGQDFEAHPAFWAPFVLVGEGAR